MMKDEVTKNKIFIFDFDGVIVDSFEEVLKTWNLLAEKYRFNQVDLAQMEELRKLNSWQLYVEKFGVSPWKMFFGVRMARAALKEKIPLMKPAEGIEEVLKKLKIQNQSQGIISSNSIENVQTFLHKNHLEVFDFITTGQIFFKHRGINKCLKQNGFERQRTFYIGDETRDIEAAKKAGIKSVAVTWGYTAKETLAQYRPDYLIDRPEELLNI